MDHQKSIAIIISEFDRSANIWRHTFCGWNIKQNNSWFPVLKGDCSSPAYLNPTYHPSLMCISHHIPLPSPTSDETNMFGIYIYIYIYPYILIYIYPYIRPSLATYTVCRSIPSHPAWTSLKTVGSQRFFWGDFPHQPAMPRSLTSFLMQFLLCIWTYSTYIPHISTLNNWAVAKTLMSFSYNLTCLPRGLPRCFCHHSFSFRGWLVSWFCFRGASAKASSSWNLQIDLALLEIDWLWLWRIGGDINLIRYSNRLPRPFRDRTISVCFRKPFRALPRTWVSLPRAQLSLIPK